MEIQRLLVSLALIFFFLASQLYWFRRLAEWGAKLIPSREIRRGLAGAGAIVYIFLFAYMVAWTRNGGTPTRLTIKTALLDAPFQWWLLGSLLGFGLFLLFWAGDRLVRALGWASSRIAARIRPGPGIEPVDPPSPDRRRFMERTAMVASAAPFVICGYGLFYGRLNLEITNRRIKLARLPKALHGFRIAQLSDIHIGPFMPAEEVRKYVNITNELRPDLVVLTGDFVTWDADTQVPVVDALAGLTAPHGLYGCLGNHEMWSDVEDSITGLFRQRSVKILRNESAIVQKGGETLNLIGVDFQSVRRFVPSNVGMVRAYLSGVERLTRPDTANILLSHNPNTFDRAAELGIDLSLAGHTHGGQVTLEYIHPALSPSRLITDYVDGLFQKGSSQLYVNRGIGTIGFPIRLGARPEITVFELVRET